MRLVTFFRLAVGETLLMFIHFAIDYDESLRRQPEIPRSTENSVHSAIKFDASEGPLGRTVLEI